MTVYEKFIWRLFAKMMKKQGYSIHVFHAEEDHENMVAIGFSQPGFSVVVKQEEKHA